MTRVPWCASKRLTTGSWGWGWRALICDVSGFPWRKYIQQEQFQVISGKLLGSQNPWKCNNQFSLAGMSWLRHSSTCTEQEVDIKRLGWGHRGRLMSEPFSQWFRAPYVSFFLFFFCIILRMFVQCLPALLESMAWLRLSGLLMYSMPST